MDLSPEVIHASIQLASAIETALNPDIPQEKRHEAYKVCEELKEKSSLSIQCSTYLALNSRDLVRHFGLQLMEYCVKYKWNELDQRSKVLLKNVTISVLHSCESDIQQHMHLHNALSRLVVELMMRESPWSNFLFELFEIASKSNFQAEIVLLTILRFAEDIITVKTHDYADSSYDLHLDFQFRLEDVFKFCLNMIANHYIMNRNGMEGVCIVNLALKLLSELVEFSLVTRVVNMEKRLLPVLCSLLAEENFQFEAAECFNRLTLYKSKLVEKRTICEFLIKSNLVRCLSQLNLSSMPNDSNGERYHLFVKKISELLSSVCSLLCPLVLCKPDLVQDFQHFTVFLEILISLCNHNSYLVAFDVNNCWNQLFKNKVFQKNTYVIACITKWVSNVAPMLVKPSFTWNQPVLKDRDRCILLDFDSEVAFHAFFCQYRSRLLDTFRHLTAVVPTTTFACAEQCLLACIEQQSHCELEWDATASLLKATTKSLPSSHDIPASRFFRLLDLCLNYKSPSPDVISSLLSCVSYLSSFVSTAPQQIRAQYMPRIFDLIFLIFEWPTQSNATTAHSKQIRRLRIHAGGVFVKFSQRYSFLLVPFYDHIRCLYVKSKSDPCRLNRMESVMLAEGMLLISNHFNDYQRQSDFVAELFDEVHVFWMKLYYELIHSDCSKFAEFVGLFDTQCDAVNGSAVYNANRLELMYCVDITTAIIRWCRWPKCEQTAAKGGFIEGPMRGAAANAYRNPCTPHVSFTLPIVFALIKTLHSLWCAEAKAKLPPAHANVLEPSMREIRALLGNRMPEQLRDTVEETVTLSDYGHLHSFLGMFYESCVSLLTNACQNLGTTLYELPNFVTSFVTSVFHNFHSVPDHRIRAIIKTFFPSFIAGCPPDKYDSILLPICEYLCADMLQRLTFKWSYLKDCRTSGKVNEDSGEDCKELLDELLNTQLSREYMDMVKLMLLKSNGPAGKQSKRFKNASEKFAMCPRCLSDLGVKLLRHKTIGLNIMKYLTNAILWPDSANSKKAASVIPSIIKQLLLDRNNCEEMANLTLISLMHGLKLHGQHDDSRKALLHCWVLTYQLLRPEYSQQLMKIMHMIPNINLADLRRFDDEIARSGVPGDECPPGLIDMFRNLVIGETIE